MTFTQEHSYKIIQAGDNVSYLVMDENDRPWGRHDTRIKAEFQISFLTTGKSIEQRIAEFDEVA